MHIAELEARFDGPIPAALRAKADHRPQPPAAARTTLRVRMKPAALISNMAAILAERFLVNGCATEADLRLAGFSVADIIAHGPAATALARQTVLEG